MRRRESIWIRYKWRIRANLIIWPILLYAYGNMYGIFPPINLGWLNGSPRPGLFAPATSVSAITGEAGLAPSTPEATAAPPTGGYEDIRQPVGIVESNLYTERVIQDDAIGKLRGSTRDQPDVNLIPQWPITADDRVAVLEEWTNDQGRWFKIIIVSSSVDPHYNGQGGWVLAWLIDGQGVPPPPTPTVETPTAEPSATLETIPTVELPTLPTATVPEPTSEPELTPTSGATVEDPFDPNSPVEFNKESVPSTAKVNEGELRGCVDGFVMLHRGPAQVTVQFTQAETVLTADVDSNGHYRICDMAAGEWSAIVLALAGEPFADSDSSQLVTIVEGDVSSVSWYEKEPAF